MFQGSKISAAALLRRSWTHHGMFAAETLLAYSIEQERTGGDLDAVMQLGSAGGRGARGGAKRI